MFYPTVLYRIQPASSITRADQRITLEEREFDAWTWGFGDYITEVMQGYGPTMRYILEVIQTAGPFIGIVGFSAGATTAHTLVSLAEHRVFTLQSHAISPPIALPRLCKTYCETRCSQKR